MTARVSLLIALISSIASVPTLPFSPHSGNVVETRAQQNTRGAFNACVGLFQPKATTATGNKSNNSSSENFKLSEVTRLAVRPFKKDGSSAPASKGYTTKKEERDTVAVTKSGVADDYNHYRTNALNSTLDRALSIVTQNIYDDLRVMGYPEIETGDLGENLLVEGINHTDLAVGARCQIGSDVLVEITERIEPCGNLCKLSFINDDKLAPPLRVKKCISFLKLLDEPEGYRGWYARIIKEGTIEKGDAMKIL